MSGIGVIIVTIHIVLEFGFFEICFDFLLAKTNQSHPLLAMSLQAF